MTIFARSTSAHSYLPSPLPDPKFVAAHLIPDNADRDNDKVYFFFTERAVEAGDREGAIHARVGRVCAVRFPRAPSLDPVHDLLFYRGWSAKHNCS